SAPARDLLAALADHVWPPDDQTGGAALGAVPYIERLLLALESDPPRIFAAGPFSGRQPFATDGGAPGTERPPNDFLRSLPLPRVSRVAWQLRLYGSDGSRGGGPNDATLGKITGLRDQLQAGLDQALQAVPAGTQVLDAATVEQVWSGLSDDLRTALTEL